MSTNCECQKAVFDDTEILKRYRETYDKNKAGALYWQYVLDEFSKVRGECPALKEILIPDSIWGKYKEKALENMDKAHHQYKILGCYITSCLEMITVPIHIFLLENGKPKSQLAPQYKKDLQEKWMLKDNELERHKKSRIYNGKLTELCCANWLKTLNWKIKSLEALGGKGDIKSLSPDNENFTIEVKYLGQDNDAFTASINSSAYNPALYAGTNFILLKVYDGAKQLKDSENNKMVILVISNTAWNKLEIPIKYNYIKWETPEFFNDDITWNNFMNEEKNKKKYSDINNDLKETIGNLSRIWIVKEESNLQYSLQHIINLMPINKNLSKEI